MVANRSSDTGPERALRAALNARGLRFFKNRRPDPSLRCRADIVFPSARVAVFVDGCFWHRCPLHGVDPKKNSEYWEAKLDRNVLRDRRDDDALLTLGWTVMRIWEHEPPEQAAADIAPVVLAARDRILGQDGRPKRGRTSPHR